jgi:hypothetical protein
MHEAELLLKVFNLDVVDLGDGVGCDDPALSWLLAELRDE